ncbi:MAG: lysine exporter protein [Actinoallomurus sp.]|nr:lysine exporter protein [Actinoallomurus sp.]
MLADGVLFGVGRALAYGRRTALPSVVGGETGVLVMVVAVALGLGAVVERSPVFFTVVKPAGAGYLVYLGVRAWRDRRSRRQRPQGLSIRPPCGA